MYDLLLLKNTRESSVFNSMSFVAKQRAKLSRDKPYQGLSILQNVPLTFSTIFKVEALALGGATVTSFASNIIPPDPKAISVLEQANFKVVTELPQTEQYDLHLDCCAELLGTKAPRLGAVELTQSGSMMYQAANLDYPVVSVDDSKLKVLETFLGTGEGFARALHEKVGDAKFDKPYVVFGYGKVGKGIIYALENFSKDITVIDLESSLTKQKPGLKYISASDTQAVKQALAQSFAVITATGQRDLLTKNYNLTRADFGDALLINMGAEDEYGANFSETEVEYCKKPFNFSLEMPTALRYLDPIFYAHNAAIDLILDNTAQKGYNPFPNDMAMNIINEWHAIYNEPVEEALLSF